MQRHDTVTTIRRRKGNRIISRSRQRLALPLIFVACRPISLILHRLVHNQVQRHGAIRLQCGDKVLLVSARCGIGMVVPGVACAGSVVNIGVDGRQTRGEMPHRRPCRGVHRTHLAHTPVVEGVLFQIVDSGLTRAHRYGPFHQVSGGEVGRFIILVMIEGAALNVVPVQRNRCLHVGGAVGRRYQRKGSRRGETPRGTPVGGVEGGVFTHPPVVGLAEAQGIGKFYFAGAHSNTTAHQIRCVEVGAEVVLVLIIIAVLDVVPVQGGLDGAVEGAAVVGRYQRETVGRGETPHIRPAGGVAAHTDTHPPVVGLAVTQLVELFFGSADCDGAALQLR